MVEKINEEPGFFDKYGIKSVRARLTTSSLNNLKLTVIDPSPEITSEGKIKGSMKERLGRSANRDCSVASLMTFMDRSKGGYTFKFIVGTTVMGTFQYAAISGYTPNKNLSEDEQVEIEGKVIEKYLNPLLTPQGIVLRKDEAPQEYDSEIVRYYACKTENELAKES